MSGLQHIIEKGISEFRMKIRISKLLDLFSRSTFACPSCSAVFPLEQGKMLGVVTCGKCNCPILKPSQIDDFLVFQPLGGGGMGSVYLCVSFSSHKTHAIKLLPRKKRSDSAYVDSLIKEGIVHKDIADHINIVGMLKSGRNGDEYFVVTEFIRGERLDSFIETEAPLLQKDAIDIILQLIDAEIHIFSKGYCYRDMKPENIIIQDNGTVKLFDFGLTLRVKEAAHPAMENPIIEGSPYFLPPERLMGRPEGESSEIYSLGMLLFFLLTGRHYYTEKEVNALARKHIFGLRVNSTSRQIAHCNSIMIKVLDKMIRRSPMDRFQHLTDLRDILQKVRKMNR